MNYTVTWQPIKIDDEVILDLTRATATAQLCTKFSARY